MRRARQGSFFFSLPRSCRAPRRVTFKPLPLLPTPPPSPFVVQKVVFILEMVLGGSSLFFARSGGTRPVHFTAVSLQVRRISSVTGLVPPVQKEEPRPRGYVTAQSSFRPLKILFLSLKRFSSPSLARGVERALFFSGIQLEFVKGALIFFPLIRCCFFFSLVRLPADPLFGPSLFHVKSRSLP